MCVKSSSFGKTARVYDKYASMGGLASREPPSPAITPFATPTTTPSKPLRSTKSTSQSLFIGDRRGEKIKVLFCGNHFEDGFQNTKQALSDEKNLVVVQCNVDDIKKEITDAHVVVPLMSKIRKDLIQHAPRLALIMQFGVGLEGVDVQAATEAGIWVAKIESTHCGNAQSCAEHAIYLALAVLRDQKAMTNAIVSGKLGQPTGRTLMNSKVLIYGYGGIGRQLSRRLRPFVVTVVAIKKTLADSEVSGDLDEEPLDDLGLEADFPALVAGVDVIFLCCSQNPDNVGMVNKAFLSHCKPGVVIVNVSRGGLLNYDDVLDGLESGHISGVGLDVFHTEPFPKGDPLLLHPKCIATPHVAGVTRISYENMAQFVANNIIRMRAGKEPISIVNEIETD